MIEAIRAETRIRRMMETTLLLICHNHLTITQSN
jgi:hypothetical protein